ncbi:secretogranin-2a [Synchiropus splendidus]|uniref:secretogranin-2a n=1 Tax=Synchiropus splendidus TaxID=270530 RepID=UPI00237E7CA5|nr:secretogranin-2a [Synchiropus splendidus]
MSSLLCSSTRGNPSLAWCASLLLLCLTHVHGASLRDHRLRGSESDPQRGSVHRPPNADMLKALEYIESLGQRAESDVQAGRYDGARVDDTEKLQAMMRLASRPTNEDEEGADEGQEDKSEELLQAVLSTLQQTEQASKPTTSLGGSSRGSSGVREQQKQQAIMPHKKLPLMFEDDEEGEGDEEEEDERGPYKRTTENVEEKYTPQNLATLQSVFDELDKFTTGKTATKRQDEEDVAQQEEEDEAEDLFNVRNVAYDDFGADLANWGPLDEKEEEEEEDKHELDRGLDYVEDEDEDANDEEEEEESYPVKRSSDPDDVTNLVDYYIFKVLEKTEEEQKRAIEEEEEEEKEREERRVAQYRENIDPRVVYEILRISQKYQIPPEDLLDMLRSRSSSTSQNRKSSQLPRAGNQLSQLTYKVPPSRFYSRRLPQRQQSPQNLQTERILNLLGLGGAETEAEAPVRKQQSYKSSLSRFRPAERPGESTSPQRRPPAKLKEDYDDTVGEDELAAYLTSQMLSRYPKPSSYRATQKREEAGQAMTGSFEQAIQDYLDQMDSDKQQNEKRQSEDDVQNSDTQSFDNDAVMKLLNYLNPETEESDAKTAPGA